MNKTLDLVVTLCRANYLVKQNVKLEGKLNGNDDKAVKCVTI